MTPPGPKQECPLCVEDGTCKYSYIAPSLFHPDKGINFKIKSDGASRGPFACLFGCKKQFSKYFFI